jgi:hypothetical protein
VKYLDAVTTDKEFTALFTSYEAKPTTLADGLVEHSAVGASHSGCCQGAGGGERVFDGGHCVL